MGAEEGPRAPNEPPTPQIRTKDRFSLSVLGVSISQLEIVRELPKHVGFSA